MNAGRDGDIFDARPRIALTRNSAHLTARLLLVLVPVDQRCGSRATSSVPATS
jgi:hypothetical protein